MTDYTQLFHHRKQLDAKQQPTWQHALVELDQWLTGHPPPHPYERDHCSLCQVPRLTDVCKGPPVRLEKCEALYRISAVGDVIRRDNGKGPFSTNITPDNLHQLFADQSTRDTWLPLSNYIEGDLPGRRNFTWWTPFELSALPVLPNAHRIGIPNDWVSRYALILRLDTKGRDIAKFGKVPTVIDGYDSPIFHATSEPNARIGTAIDLRHPESLQPGADELVIDRIPSKDIKILPVDVSDHQRRQYPVDVEAVLPALVSYYATQGA